MKCEFYKVGVAGDVEGSTALNKALGGGGVVSVRKEFVQNGEASYWAFCVERVSVMASRSTSFGSKAEKIDYKEKLSPEDFKLFSKLREARKQLAEAEAIPAYSICTNEQLALIVEKNIRSKSALLEVEGFGQVRCEKYGEAILAVMGGKAEGEGS